MVNMKFIIGPLKNNKKQKVKIKIRDCDVWNLDYTMALILLPMFKRLKKIKGGASLISDDDVPDELKSTNVAVPTEYDLDDNYFKRYEWVLSEIIWALKETQPTAKYKQRDDYLEYEARLNNAFRLMGTYWRTFWD